MLRDGQDPTLGERDNDPKPEPSGLEIWRTVRAIG